MLFVGRERASCCDEAPCISSSQQTRIFMGFYSDQDPLQVTDSPELPEDPGGEGSEFVDPATDYIAIDSAIFADSGEIKFKPDAQPNSRLLARPEVFVEGTNASETLQGKKGKTNSISGLGGDDVLLGYEQRRHPKWWERQ
jgi:hypothetical protein